MTVSKAAIPMQRTPTFVSREIGAAELCISPATWDRWVASGKLPPAVAGFPGGRPRWRWAEVERRIGSEPQTMAADGYEETLATGDDAATVDPFVAAAGKFRYVPTKSRRHG